jgi:hypothetical protein
MATIEDFRRPLILEPAHARALRASEGASERGRQRPRFSLDHDGLARRVALGRPSTIFPD